MYYPKSQIKTNLYTNGEDYILSTTKLNYSGFYYEISNGNKYTGKTPSTKPNILLLPLKTPQLSLPTNFSSPNSVITLNNPDDTNPYYPPYDLNYVKNTPSRLIPIFNPTLPTDQDKQKGQFNRYFCKKTNELKYLEIDKETYDQLKAKDPKIAWDLYEPASLLWVIKGTQENVFNTNKLSVFKIEQNQRWYGFSQYFKENYSKYYLEL
jgi:hypothetical protein